MVLMHFNIPYTSKYGFLMAVHEPSMFEILDVVVRLLFGSTKMGILGKGKREDYLAKEFWGALSPSDTSSS